MASNDPGTAEHRELVVVLDVRGPWIGLGEAHDEVAMCELRGTPVLARAWDGQGELHAGDIAYMRGQGHVVGGIPVLELEVEP